MKRSNKKLNVLTMENSLVIWRSAISTNQLSKAGSIMEAMNSTIATNPSYSHLRTDELKTLQSLVQESDTSKKAQLLETIGNLIVTGHSYWGKNFNTEQFRALKDILKQSLLNGRTQTRLRDGLQLDQLTQKMQKKYVTHLANEYHKFTDNHVRYHARRNKTIFALSFVNKHFHNTLFLGGGKTLNLPTLPYVLVQEKILRFFASSPRKLIQQACKLGGKNAKTLAPFLPMHNLDLRFFCMSPAGGRLCQAYEWDKPLRKRMIQEVLRSDAINHTNAHYGYPDKRHKELDPLIRDEFPRFTCNPLSLDCTMAIFSPRSHILEYENSDKFGHLWKETNKFLIDVATKTSSQAWLEYYTKAKKEKKKNILTILCTYRLATHLGHILEHTDAPTKYTATLLFEAFSSKELSFLQKKNVEPTLMVLLQNYKPSNGFIASLIHKELNGYQYPSWKIDLQIILCAQLLSSQNLTPAMLLRNKAIFFAACVNDYRVAEHTDQHALKKRILNRTRGAGDQADVRKMSCTNLGNWDKFIEKLPEDFRICFVGADKSVALALIELTVSLFDRGSCISCEYPLRAVFQTYWNKIISKQSSIPEPHKTPVQFKTPKLFKRLLPALFKSVTAKEIERMLDQRPLNEEPKTGGRLTP